MPSIFIETSQKKFYMKAVRCQLSPKFVLRSWEIVGPERGHPFVWCGILAKKVWSQKLWACKKKELDFSDLSLKKIHKVLRKIEEMADVFLNSANLEKYTFLTLAPPSSYALNLKALIKVSKVSQTSQFSYEILRSSSERKFDI